MQSWIKRIESVLDRRPSKRPSKSAGAGRKHDGKVALGIKAKLFLAFGGMAMLTVGASAVAWYAFTDIDRSVTRITAESIVGMAASLRLAEKSAEITATAPALIASNSEEERIKEQERLVQRLNEISAVTEGLKVTGMAEARSANLIEIEGKIATELKALDGAVAQRLRLSAQRQTAVADIAVVETKFQNALEPLVDDAGFNLVATSEEVTAKSKEAITGLIEGGVNALQALLTLRADGNLAASLLGEAAHMDDPALIQPIRERFSAATAAIEKSLEALPQSLENERLHEASEALIALGGGGGGAPHVVRDADADGGRCRLRPRHDQRRRDGQEHEGDHQLGRGWGKHLAGAADAARPGHPGGGPAE